jgi:hypothetical protein
MSKGKSVRGVGSAGAFGCPNFVDHFVDHFVLHFVESCPGPISLLTFMKGVINLLPLQTVTDRYKPFQTACRSDALAKAVSNSGARNPGARVLEGPKRFRVFRVQGDAT